MKNRNVSAFERLFFNKKFLMIFSLLTAVILWTVVKANYGEMMNQRFNELSVYEPSLQTDSGDFEAFYNPNKLHNVTVRVSGLEFYVKALKDDDIIVEAKPGQVDSAGYRDVNLNAYVNNNNDDNVKVLSVSPSTMKVFYDTKVTGFERELEVRVTNEDEVVAKGYALDLERSNATVKLSGPQSVLNRITKVYYNVEIPEDQIPLTKEYKTSNISISYEIDHKEATASTNKQLLYCELEGEVEAIIPVKHNITRPLTIDFVGQPKSFAERLPKYSITPQTVNLLVDGGSANDITNENLIVGTVYFRELKNAKNTKYFTIDQSYGTLTDGSDGSVKVQVDLSNYKSALMDVSTNQVELRNKADNLNYTPNLYEIKNTLDPEQDEGVMVIGPKASLSKIRPGDLQLEIDVSALTEPTDTPVAVEISNIYIRNEGVDDCWVYGTYKALITVTAAEQ